MRIIIYIQPIERRLERVYYLGSNALEGFCVLNIGAPGNTARMVGTVLSDLRLVLVQVALCGHGLHGLLLEGKNRADIDKRGGNESAVFRLMGLKQEQFCWFDGGETTGDARAAGQDTGALDGGRGQRVIGIERIAFGMGDDHVWG